MPLRPASRPKRLYRQIADQIVRLIERGEYLVGTRLPSEREIADRLAVSRASVREALIALEIAGYVEVRVGSGIYVREPTAEQEAVDAQDPEISPFDALEARWLIEGECAALAAKNATAADIKRIERAFQQLCDDLRTTPAVPLGDGQFHSSIAQASGNTAYQAFVRKLWDQRRLPVYRRLDELLVSKSRYLLNIEEHRAILAAIVGRDAGAARSAMRRHIRNIARQRLSKPGV